MSNAVTFDAWAVEINGSIYAPRGCWDLYKNPEEWMTGECRRPVRVRVTVEALEESSDAER